MAGRCRILRNIDCAARKRSLAPLGSCRCDQYVHLILYKLSNLYKMRTTMPAPTPPVGEILAAKLVAVGERIRAHRKRQKVTATSTAEAAGMSRVTLHRIERGEPSVTMGAYLSAIAALGLEFDVIDPQVRRRGAGVEPGVPTIIRLDEYPQLKRLAWQRHGENEVTPSDALALYERNWRHVDQSGIEPRERALIQALVETLGAGRLLV